MKLIATAATLLASTVVVAQDTCFTDASNPDAPINADQSVADLIPSLTPVLQLLPESAETCLASYSSSKLLELLTTVVSDSSCSALLTLPSNPAIQNLVNNFPSELDLPSGLAFLKFIHETEDSTYADVCDATDSNLRTCVSNVIPSLLTSLSQDSNGCCDPLLNALAQDVIGTDDVAGYVNTLVNGIMDAICASRTPGFDGSDSQTCGFTIVQQLFNPETALSTFPLSLNVPNDAANACAAYEGEVFTTANGDADKQFVPEGKAISGCAVHLDSIATSFGSLKIIQDNDALSQIFADDQCLALADIVGLLPDGTLPDSATGLIGGILPCVHLANGYSSECTFSATSDFINGPPGDDQQGGGDGDNASDDDNGNSSSITSTSFSLLLLVLAAVFMI